MFEFLNDLFSVNSHTLLSAGTLACIVVSAFFYGRIVESSYAVDEGNDWETVVCGIYREYSVFSRAAEDLIAQKPDWRRLEDAQNYLEHLLSTRSGGLLIDHYEDIELAFDMITEELESNQGYIEEQRERAALERAIRDMQEGYTFIY